MPSLFALAFHKGYRLVNARINSGINAYTSCKNLVNISPVTLEFKNGVCGIFFVTGPQFDEHRLFGTLAFQNELEYRNFDFSRLINNHFCSLCRNFVKFSSVTLKF